MKGGKRRMSLSSVAEGAGDDDFAAGETFADSTNFLGMIPEDAPKVRKSCARRNTMDPASTRRDHTGTRRRPSLGGGARRPVRQGWAAEGSAAAPRPKTISQMQLVELRTFASGLQKEVTTLKISQRKNEAMIESLKKKVAELEKDNKRCKGKLEASQRALTKAGGDQPRRKRSAAEAKSAVASVDERAAGAKLSKRRRRSGAAGIGPIPETFSSNAESALAAGNAPQNVTRVRRHTMAPGEVRRPGGKEAVMRIEGLKQGTSAQQIFGMFAQIEGTITNVRTAAVKDSVDIRGYVTFQSNRDARAALKGFQASFDFRASLM